MLNGHAIAQALSVAARLQIADLVADSPLGAEELASQTGTHAPSLYRMLRTLASFGVFREDQQGRFSLTPLAGCLRKDADDSQWAFAMLAGQEFFRAWGELMYSVQTGESGFKKAFGKPIFDYLGEHPDKARLFDAAMTSVHGRESAAMLEAYDLTGVGTFVDIGGGNGKTLVAVLKRYPGMSGVLFDLPHVVEAAQGTIRSAGLESRLRTVGGSFFESVPSGGDVYLLRHIIHDWYDEQSTQILRNCRKALRDDARLLVVESVILPGNEPAVGKMLDLAMMVLPGGMERTEKQYRELFARAGFRLDKIVPTAAEVSVIEARPA
jgi:SAM-dependent methyltransferase